MAISMTPLQPYEEASGQVRALFEQSDAEEAFRRAARLRIDYLLVSGDVAGRVRGVGVDRNFRKGTKPSDHAPLIAWLDEDPGDRGKQV